MRKASSRRRKHGLVHVEQSTSLARRRSGHAAVVGHPRPRRIDRHQVWLRRRPVRRLHRSRRRHRAALVPDPDVALDGAKVVTIEGLSPNSSHPLQKAWIAEEVPQCGYCQSGQIMKAAELLAENPKPCRARHRHPHGRQYLPLWDLSPHHRRHRARIAGGLSHDHTIRHQTSPAAAFSPVSAEWHSASRSATTASA